MPEVLASILYFVRENSPKTQGNLMLITLPGWFCRLPFIRDRVFWPQIILRSDPVLHVVRWGVMPDGQEWGFGSTVNQNLMECIAEYRSVLSQMGFRFVAPIQIEGTDFSPLAEKGSKVRSI